MIEWLLTFLEKDQENNVILISYENGGNIGGNIEMVSNILIDNGLSVEFELNDVLNNSLYTGVWKEIFDDWKAKGYIN